MSRWPVTRTALILAALGWPAIAVADALTGQTEQQAANWPAILMFAAFVLATLGITRWAARRVRSASDFYTAGGGITGFQNGLAIAGDYMSAASFLGISAQIFADGYDGLIYSTGFLVGWPILLFLLAERLRNLGRYTFADVASFRFAQTPVRLFAAFSTLAVVLFYLIAQMVGAGQLIKLLFGLPYSYAVLIVGALMTCYVLFGGMIATTWVQIIKAVMLLGCASFMAFAVLWSFGFSPEALFAKAVEIKTGLAAAGGAAPGEAAAKGLSIMGPGGFIKDPLSAISFGMALMFGTAGLPHILMRFFTVPDAKEARKSVLWATGWIGYFYILTFIIGFGAITFVASNPDYLMPDGTLKGGGNMAAIHLAAAIGGDLFLGVVSAVAFATILAVVAGLTLSGASAVSHDIYASIVKRGEANSADELRVSRMTVPVLAILAILLGIAFEKQNVAFMVSLAFALAASGNFPVLVMSLLWRGCTTRGVVVGGFAGVALALVLTILSPAIWEAVLGYPDAPFPYSSPTLFSMPAAFLAIWLVSLADGSGRAAVDRAGYPAQRVRAETGIGAAGRLGALTRMVLAPAGSAAAGPAGRFAGVELGGTKVVVTLADGLDIVERHSLPTTNPGDTLGAAVDMLAAWDAQAPLAAIGIASFGPIRLDPAAADYGTMLATTKPGWAGAGVVAAFASRFDCPVALDTDVNGAGIAEAALGAGQGCRTIVYLTIGTGVGGGVIVDGWPAPGRFHPEIGHLRLRRADGDGFAGTCSFHGDCIEGLISGPALRARFGRDPATVDPVDPAWDMVASDLAELFAALMLTLSPDRIVVGGSVALGQPDLVARATRLAGETLATYIGDYDVAALSCIIGPPMLGHDAGPLGSILLAIRASQCGTPGVTTGLRSAALRDSRG